MTNAQEILANIPHKKLCAFPGCTGTMELVRWTSKKTGDKLVNYVCSEEGWSHTHAVKDAMGRRVIVD